MRAARDLLRHRRSASKDGVLEFSSVGLAPERTGIALGDVGGRSGASGAHRSQARPSLSTTTPAAGPGREVVAAGPKAPEPPEPISVFRGGGQRASDGDMVAGNSEPMPPANGAPGGAGYRRRLFASAPAQDQGARPNTSASLGELPQVRASTDELVPVFDTATVEVLPSVPPAPQRWLRGRLLEARERLRGAAERPRRPSGEADEPVVGAASRGGGGHSGFPNQPRPKSLSDLQRLADDMALQQYLGQ